jgi:hypothetical protein
MLSNGKSIDINVEVEIFDELMMGPKIPNFL